MAADNIDNSKPARSAANENAGLWESVQSEIERLRAEEASTEASAHRAQEWLEQQILIQDLEKLQIELRSKLGVIIQPTRNPEEVDGLWFGVRRRYIEEFDEVAYSTRITWELTLYRPCNLCGALRPGLAFATSSQPTRKPDLKQRVLNKITKMREAVLNRDNQVSENIRELARYLHDVEAGRCANPYDEMCPTCGNA